MGIALRKEWLDCLDFKFRHSKRGHPSESVSTSSNPWHHMAVGGMHSESAAHLNLILVDVKARSWPGEVAHKWGSGDCRSQKVLPYVFSTLSWANGGCKG